MALASNIITTLFARAGVLLLALVSSIILARVLGPEGRGLFALVLLLPELAITFGLLGFETANTVFAGLEPDSRRVLAWHSAALAGVLGFVIAMSMMCYLALGAPGLPVLSHGPFRLYLLALSIVPIVLAIEYWQAILRGMNYIFLMNVVEVGSKFMSLIVLLVFVIWLRLGVTGAVLAHFVLNLSVFVTMAILLCRVGILGKPSFDWSLWKRTARFAFPAYCSTTLNYVNYRVDQFIIAVLLPPEQLAFYVIAVALAERLLILTGAVSNALLPHLTNSKERDPAISAEITRHVIVWTGAGCLVIFLLADPVIRVMYSAAFAEAVAPLRWLLPGIFVSTVGKVIGAEILARRKIYFLLGVAAIAAGTNIVGNLVLIPRMGISGASLASSISYSVISILVTCYTLRITKLSWGHLSPRTADFYAYSLLWSRVSSSVVGGLKRAIRAQP